MPQEKRVSGRYRQRLTRLHNAGKISKPIYIYYVTKNKKGRDMHQCHCALNGSRFSSRDEHSKSAAQEAVAKMVYDLLKCAKSI